jgi:hypothetical protein
MEKSPYVSSHLVLMKSLCAPFDFYDGVTCSFSLGVASNSTLHAFNVIIDSRIGLVYTYNLTIEFDFNGEVEEISMKCQQLDLAILFPLEAITLIMFILVTNERLLKVLS